MDLHFLEHLNLNFVIQALTITGIVIIMMILIEVINIYSKGRWLNKLETSKGRGIILGTLFGLLPGCMGTYFIVSLFTHGNITLGALVATFIATSGDEAFFMFSLFPLQAVYIHIILFFVALLFGFLTDFVFKKRFFTKNQHHLELHHAELENKIVFPSIRENFRNISFQRALLIFLILLMIFNMIMGIDGHSHSHGHEHEEAETMHGAVFQIEGYINYAFIFASLIALVALLRVPDHFISEHIWGHVIKKHFVKLFLWTAGAIFVITFLLPEIHAEEWIKANPYILLLLAALIGIIPESGPHMVFISLFAGGFIPVSVLITSSIVQDGHGSLPLLAESPKNFIVAKIINIVAGLAVGLVLLSFGF